MTGNTKVWKILYAGRRGLDRKSKIDKVIGDEVLAILSKDTVWMTHLFSLSREPVTCENAPLCWVSKHFYFSQCFPQLIELPWLCILSQSNVHFSRLFCVLESCSSFASPCILTKSVGSSSWSCLNFCFTLHSLKFLFFIHIHILAKDVLFG